MPSQRGAASRGGGEGAGVARPLAALPDDPYSLIMGEQEGAGTPKQFVEVEVGTPKPGTGY